MKVSHKSYLKVVHRRKTNYKVIFITIISLFILGLLFSCNEKKVEHTKYDGHLFKDVNTGDLILLKHHYMSTYKIIELPKNSQ